MTLPASGLSISMSQVNVELTAGATTQISLNDTAVRSLAGRTVNASQISMSDLQGKSGIVRLPSAANYTTNQTNLYINVATLTGYVAGKSDLTITIGSGVYIYSTATNTPGLTITGASAGDTIRLVNNGYIIGKGGDATGDYYTAGVGNAGGPAMSLGCSVIITNNGYIAGGGGGGGHTGGGGGAGGGNGSNSSNMPGAAPMPGGGPGQAGTSPSGTITYCVGGGGGRVLPGQGGLQSAGGGAGGGGGYWIFRISGMLTIWSHQIGGGGGGWGAAGGSGTSGSYPTNYPGTAGIGGSGGSPGGNGVVVSVTTTKAGGAGGAAILKNGYAVTWAASGTVYGSEVA